jgi:hypothetical protein
LFDAYVDGSLHRAFEKTGVRFSETSEIDPYSLRPGWLHPRQAG